MTNNISSKIFAEMVETLQETLRFETLKGKPEENMPFGKQNALCLQYVLGKAEQMGFSTFNCDNYAGHVDFGHGDLYGVLGHLDVVPVTDGWDVPPFSGTIKDGMLYGRGVNDNKGPMIACLYVLKQLKEEGVLPNKTIRLIFGCDEESGWGCMRYYRQKVEMPKSGFSPDADFPVINAEKGVIGYTINCGKLDSDILDITAGQRTNIVPDYCCATLKNDVNAQIDGVKITGNKIEGFGKSSHGSAPQDGVNASFAVFDALHKLFPNDQTLKFISEKISRTYHGENWGVFFQDKESGKITLNLGTVKMVDGDLILGFDVRFPVTCTAEQVTNAITTNSPSNFAVKTGHSIKPLFVPKDSPFIAGLLNSYKAVTGDDAQPIAIGGATYARSLPLGVAFGPVFPGQDGFIHQVNERVSLENLKKIMEIYYLAIKDACLSK